MKGGHLIAVEGRFRVDGHAYTFDIGPYDPTLGRFYAVDPVEGEDAHADEARGDGPDPVRERSDDDDGEEREHAVPDRRVRMRPRRLDEPLIEVVVVRLRHRDLVACLRHVQLRALPPPGSRSLRAAETLLISKVGGEPPFYGFDGSAAAVTPATTSPCSRSDRCLSSSAPAVESCWPGSGKKRTTSAQPSTISRTLRRRTLRVRRIY